jgi:hypothetical protein
MGRLGQRVEVVAINGLPEAGGSLETPTLLVVGSRVVTDECNMRALLALRSREPLLHIILFLSGADRLKRNLSTLVRAAVDAFVILDEAQDASSLRNEVEDRLTHLLPKATSRFLRSGSSRSVLEESWCVRNAYRRVSVSHVAGHVKLNRRTIYRDTHRSGWHDVEHLIDAARFLHVAHWLDSSGLSVERVAEILRFSSPRAIRKFVGRVAGISCSALRGQGALGVAIRFWKARAVA